MKLVKISVRFVLVLVVLVLFIVPTVGALSPPDPLTQLFLSVPLVVFVAVPLAGVFVRRSYSLRRLVTYFFAVNVLVVPLGLVAGGLGAVVQPLVGQSDIVRTLITATIVGGAYVLAFYLVYRGGYARLKARLG